MDMPWSLPIQDFNIRLFRKYGIVTFFFFVFFFVLFVLFFVVVFSLSKFYRALY